MAWLTDLLGSILMKLMPWALSKLMEWADNKIEEIQKEKQIEARLQKLKGAYVKAFDGNPVTAEQKEELKDAIRNFINPSNPSK